MSQELEREHEHEFTAFFLAHRHRLVKIVVGLCGDRHLAEDVAQEVMIKLRDYWGAYQKPEILMVRMAKQELARRNRKSAPGLLDSLDARIGEIEAKAHHPAADAGLAEFDKNNVPMRALRSLPTRQKEVIVLVVLCGLDLQAAAEILGISESAVSTHKKRGLARLGTLLAGWTQASGSGAEQPVGGA